MIFDGLFKPQISSPSGIINGHGYVDLGLSVKWSTCNLGARFPVDYGDHYAWGETMVKFEYTYENSLTFRKDVGNSIAGNPQYDAARANWGGTWRMPTYDEIDELDKKCKKRWMTVEGHNGLMITSSNGNSIFLPAGGSTESSTPCGVEEWGPYWGATPASPHEEWAIFFSFKINSAYINVRHSYRFDGFLIRPVVTKNLIMGLSSKYYTGTINGHSYVNLGLSVKWATYNVGATDPSECGDFFAWGETKPKLEYTEENSVTYGKEMDCIGGNPQYDAAAANWGGGWRMPTSSEIYEMREKCKLERVTCGGREGYEVTGPNGNSIFLPAAGWLTYGGLCNNCEQAAYWSETPEYRLDNNNTACDICICGGDFRLAGAVGRANGKLVRPVIK